MIKTLPFVSKDVMMDGSRRHVTLDVTTFVVLASAQAVNV